MPKSKQAIEYRYYEMPPNSPILALLGSGWYRTYGSAADPLHFHNYLEIGYCYEGSGKMLFNDSELPYSNGYFTVIPPPFQHNTVADGEAKNRWEYLFVDTDSFLGALYKSDPQKEKQLLTHINTAPRSLSSEDYPEMASYILQIMNLYRDKPEMYISCAAGLLLSFLIRFVLLSRDTGGTESASNTPVIAAALEFIWKNFGEEILISDIAAACNVSETHFRRLFTESLRMSPLSYINLVRIEAACKLMRTTQEPLQVIAIKCGFFTVQSFDRNFKEKMGVTPLKWRKDTDYYQKRLENQHVVVFNGWK